MYSFSYYDPSGEKCTMSISEEVLMQDREAVLRSVAQKILSDDHMFITALAKLTLILSGNEDDTILDLMIAIRDRGNIQLMRDDAAAIITKYLSACESEHMHEINPWWAYISHVLSQAGKTWPMDYFFYSE